MVSELYTLRVTKEEREGLCYCPSCKNWFDTPDVRTWTEQHTFWGMGCEEEMSESFCPICGEESYFNDDDIIEYDENDEEYEWVRKGE